MAYTLVPTELIVDGAITSAKLDTNIAISGTLGVTGEVTLATHLIMGDNDKIKIGTGGDLEIYHDGSNSYISNSTGNIYLGDTNGAVHIQAKLNEESIICAADGAVTLYHDNSPKLATSSAGVTVTGTLAATLSTAAQPNITSVGTLTALTGGTGDLNWDSGTLFVDSSANVVGIGETSPQAGLDIASTAKGIFTSGNVYSYPTGNAYIKVKGTNAEHNWIGITGGYEQSSGSANLMLQPNFRLTSEQAGNYIGSEAQSVTTADITFGKLVGGSSTSTNATKSEFMRIDASGSLLVGKTNTTNARLGTGHIIHGTDSAIFSRDASGETMQICRNADTGDLVRFYSNAAQVGSIGTRASLLKIGTGDVGLLFNSSSDAILPENIDGGAGRDGAIDLGVAGAKFKDLYLSGTANISGLVKGMTHIELLNNGGSDSSATSPRLFSPASGTLAFSGNGLEKMRIHASGAIQHSAAASVSGVISRTTAPTGSQGLNITASVVTGLPTTTPTFADNSSSGASIYLGGNAGDQYGGSVVLKAYGAGADGNLIVFENRSGTNTFKEAMRITSAGLVAINTTTVASESALNIGAVAGAGSAEGGQLVLQKGSGGTKAIHIDNYNVSSVDYCRFMRGTDTASEAVLGAFDITNTVFVWGKNIDSNTTQGVSIRANGHLRLTTDGTGSSIQVAFFRNGSASEVGSITTTSSATAYNTSSDGRLKDVTGSARGLEVINELNPVSYNWKADGKADEGFIAQEVLDIVPNAVSGSEEEMYQMDYSKLVVHLVKGMKEQQTIINDLKSRIETLEG